MLPEPIIAMLLTASLSLIGVSIAVFGALALRRMNRLEAGIENVLEAAHENGRGINGFSQKITKVARYSEASVEFQRKVHDHQRVLLTSLNKQMRHLETMMTEPQPHIGEATAPVSHTKPSTMASGPRKVAPRPENSVKRVEASPEHQLAKPEPVPFHELFAAANRTAANTGSPQPRRIEGSEKAIMLARLFKDGKFSGVTTADGLDQVLDDASKDSATKENPVPEVGPAVASAAKANAMLTENRFAEELRKVGNG